MKRYILVFFSLMLSLVTFACQRTSTAGAEDAAGSALREKLFRIGILPYGANYQKSPLKESVIRWIAENFDWTIGGPDMGKNASSVVSVGYETILGGYSNELPSVREFAEKRGWNYENMLIHMKTDYKAIKPWQGMDKFDFFEGNNGVISESFSGFTDLTAAAYDDKPADVPFGSILYLGYGEPFDLINISIATSGKGEPTGWQYWTGKKWRNLQVQDGTERCRKSGQVRFVPPVDWERLSINNSRLKWWVRYVADNGSEPVATRIWGDNWLAADGKATNCRGWDPTSPGIINRGTPLEYNPSPPAAASARFRYQARATGYWSPTYFYFNPADLQSGVRTSAAYVADKTLTSLKKSTVRAIMYDSANNGLETGVVPPPNVDPSDLSDFANARPLTWAEANRKRYADVIRLVKEKKPEIKLGANVYPRSGAFIRTGDFALYEYHTYVRQSSSPRFITTSEDKNGALSSYDSFRRENNRNGTVGIFIYADLVDYDGKRNFLWDRSQRGPLAALTKHYIGMNENTVFVYYSEGAFRYASSDEIVYTIKDTELTVKVVRDLTSQIKYIHGKDFSDLASIPEFGMFVKIGNEVLRVNKVDNKTLSTTYGFRMDHAVGEPVGIIGTSHQSEQPLPPLERIYRWNYLFPAMKVDIGIPDRNGHLKGEHDLAWKKGDDIGGGPEIWRRDFTNAIVLHRTAGYDTPAEQYETYSRQIPLEREYYPLRVDGVTGPPVKSIAMRAGEGAILMKKPVTPRPR